MKRVLTLAIMVLGAVFALTLTSCNMDSARDKEERLKQKSQDRLLAAQPPVSLDWSLERENLNKRTKLWNDPAKVSYIYLLDYGRVMAFYTIKGKVSSVNSQVSAPEQIARHNDAAGNGASHVVSAPAEDGSYGTNGDAVFFFTTDGTYVEWSGDYMLADRPLKLETQPVLVQLE